MMDDRPHFPLARKQRLDALAPSGRCATSYTQPFMMPRALGVSGTFSHHINTSVSINIILC
jgi:hypothetical protein